MGVLKWLRWKVVKTPNISQGCQSPPGLPCQDQVLVHTVKCSGNGQALPFLLSWLYSQQLFPLFSLETTSEGTEENEIQRRQKEVKCGQPFPPVVGTHM